MTTHQPAALLQEKARKVPAPVAAPINLRRNRGERVFDLHPGVHAMVIGSYLLFVAILCTAFMTAELVVPAAIFLIGVVALFLTPALWARVVPDDKLPRQSWSEFMDEGVDCCTGQLTAGQALAQILVLPGLLISLALVMVTIRAMV
jgi:Flp pilus assembly protein TadB